jgi:hypothetical protein
LGRLGHATKLKWNAPGEWIWSQEPVQEPLIGIHTSLAVFTGSEDRQHAYVALTRGTDENTAYVFTVSCPSRRLTAAIKKSR